MSFDPFGFGKRISRLETDLELEREARARSEAFIVETLEERNILLREIHHRVKNNLQIILSILKLQSDNAEDAATRDAMRKAVNRVQAISMAHERLFKSADFTSAEATTYFRDLVSFLSSALGGGGSSGIEIVLNMDPLVLDPDRCILCGLIVNELVTNAVKHAFPQNVDAPSHEKRIIITIGREKEEFVLIVADNGVGIPSALINGRRDSLGMIMVNLLSEQLKGRLDVSVSDGTEFTIRFKTHKTMQDVGKASTLRRIRLAIEQLTEEDQSLAKRYYMDGLNMEDLSQILGVDSTELNTRLHKLRKCILTELLDSERRAKTAPIPGVGT